MKKVVLVVLDGFGINKKTPKENGITLAKGKNFEKLFSKLYAKIEASGKAVGLPTGQIGGSETGHFIIGAGRIIKENLTNINNMFEDGSFAKIDAFQDGIKHCRKNKSNLHLLQIFGPGGVHGSEDHMKKILKIIPKDISVNLHLFTDGRDMDPDSALGLMKDFEKYLKKFPNVRIASLGGRYYGMDRDNNRDRIQKAYDEIIFDQTQTSDSPSEYIAKSYEKGITDEFMLPVNFVEGERIADGDAIFHLNFRSDRARQLTQALMVSCRPDLKKQYPKRSKNFITEKLDNVYIATMTKYYKEYDGPIFLKNERVKNTLGEIISNHELRQLHLAETEKYSHVTKFFNGNRQVVYDGEKDILVPSHKVATFDLDPEMSAQEIYDEFISNAKSFDFVIINFANGDILGHTGKINSVIKAMKKLDGIIGNMISFCKQNKRELLITADHGNCEQMGTPKDPHTEHTTNPVPFWYIKNGEVQKVKPQGGLSDIAPTVLKIMGIKIPKEMTGKPLI